MWARVPNSRAKTPSCSVVSDVIIREDNRFNETRHSSHLAGITSPTLGWRKLLNPSSGICCTAPTTKLENCLYGGLKWDITFFLLGYVEFNAKGSFWGKDAKTFRQDQSLKQPNNFKATQQLWVLLCVILWGCIFAHLPPARALL